MASNNSKFFILHEMLPMGREFQVAMKNIIWKLQDSSNYKAENVKELLLTISEDCQKSHHGTNELLLRWASCGTSGNLCDITCK